MRLTTKDTVGLLMVLGTSTALLVHNAPTGHRESHVSPVADAGGAITSAVESTTIAFYDVNVVPMDQDVVLRHQVVLVRDGFVTRIGDVGVIEVPTGARRIEGGGTRYLAPGLTDAHVHLGRDPEAVLPLFIANGITTVFNLEGDERHLALRDRVRSGALVGPTIYTAGPFVDGELVRTPGDAERVVHQQERRGYDFVKLHGDLSAESFAALTEAGMDEGIPVVGHAPRNLPFSEVLEHGQVAVTHTEELIYTELMSLDPSALGPVASRMARAGTWLTPGLSTFENNAAQWGAPEGLQAALEHRGARFLPPSLRREWATSRVLTSQSPLGRSRIEDMLRFHDPLIRALHDAGVPMLTGTDSGLPGMVPGFSLHDEVSALERVGFSRYEALRSATANAGRFIRENVDADARFGTVRTGSRADLVLVDEDPRADLDILRSPAGVMVRGRWYDRAALNRMLTRVSGGA